MEDRLKNGPKDLERLKKPLQNTVKHLLQMLIAPPEYTVTFVDEASSDYQPFFEYVAALGLELPPLLT
ncbi:MAG: hypothetical protein WC058_10980 [Phycisphaeraceae bacterium]